MPIITTSGFSPFGSSDITAAYITSEATALDVAHQNAWQKLKE
jgi:hypothetical protein